MGRVKAHFVNIACQCAPALLQASDRSVAVPLACNPLATDTICSQRSSNMASCTPPTDWQPSSVAAPDYASFVGTWRRIVESSRATLTPFTLATSQHTGVKSHVLAAILSVFGDSSRWGHSWLPNSQTPVTSSDAIQESTSQEKRVFCDRQPVDCPGSSRVALKLTVSHAQHPTASPASCQGILNLILSSHDACGLWWHCGSPIPTSPPVLHAGTSPMSLRLG